MTPKEKANELFNKFEDVVDYNGDLSRMEAKKCTLICVDEIINTDALLDRCITDFLEPNEFDKMRLSYWQEVRQEIELLKQ